MRYVGGNWLVRRWMRGWMNLRGGLLFSSLELGTDILELHIKIFIEVVLYWFFWTMDENWGLWVLLIAADWSWINDKGNEWELRLVGARRNTWLGYEMTGYSMAWFKPLAG